MKTQEIGYKIDGITHKAFVAVDDSKSGSKPAVLIAHDWTGRNAFAEEKAVKLAELGFVGFALDMYGEGRQGSTNDEKAALMTPMIEDRNLLKKRMLAAFDTCANLAFVNVDQVMSIGYCFGGLCALDLARSGADVKGVVSFHGLLHAPVQKECKKITSKVLVLHGYDDPMAKPESIDEFAHEMSAAKVDWQLHAYGNTLHSFTNTQANDYDFGTVYSPNADKRSWQAMLNFLAECGPSI